MGLYSRYVLPQLIQLTCSVSSVYKQREKVIPLAHGRVIEVGFGSGLNLPLYDPEKVSRIWALEPSEDMLKLSDEIRASSAIPIDCLPSNAQNIPLEDKAADTVVITYTLCSIVEEELALQEMRRVLRPGGQLIFCEHGISPEKNIRKWQNRIDPLWSRLGGGCHLNKDIPDLIQKGGFRLTHCDQAYIPGWKIACYNYWGRALPSP